jgi:hypothetical protein
MLSREHDSTTGSTTIRKVKIVDAQGNENFICRARLFFLLILGTITDMDVQFYAYFVVKNQID